MKRMKPADIRSRIIDNGIRNLREFGYPKVTPENILTDLIYRTMFARMLKENLGAGAEYDAVIHELIGEIAAVEDAEGGEK